MATLFNATLIRDNSTDARFRAWAQFVEDVLVSTGGWVVTSDTGQTAPGSLIHPAGTNTKAGYRIYRMNDTLQATNPVFMRIDFGSASAATVPGFWVTIGGGSDGAGNITNLYWNGGLQAAPNVWQNVGAGSTPLNSYGSAGPARATIAMWVGSTGCTVFCIERTKNAAGADTGAGLLLLYTSATAGNFTVDQSRYVILVGGPQPAVELGLAYILTMQNPTQSFGGDIGVAVVSHFKGVAQQPGLNFLIVNQADFGNESSFNTTIYGTTHTYQHLNTLTPSKSQVGTQVNDSSARCAMRYE